MFGLCVYVCMCSSLCYVVVFVVFVMYFYIYIVFVFCFIYFICCFPLYVSLCLCLFLARGCWFFGLLKDAGLG